MTPSSEQINTQILRELGYYEEGKESYYLNSKRLRDCGKASETNGVKKLIESVLQKFILVVDTMLYPTEVKRGKIPMLQSYLNGLSSDKVSYIVLSAICNTVAVNQKLTVVSERIGHVLELEMRLQNWLSNSTEDGKVSKVIETANRQSSFYRQERLLCNKMLQSGVEFTAWSKVDKMKLGLRFIDATIGLGLFTLSYESLSNKKYHRTAVLKPSEGTLEFLTNFDKQEEYNHARYSPSLIVPKAWSETIGGGLYNTVHEPLTFLKGYHSTGHTKRDKYFYSITADKVKPVLDSLNALQETAWTVNTQVLKVLEDVWNQSIRVSSLPLRTDGVLPEYPEATLGNLKKAEMSEDQLMVFKKFCQSREVIYKANRASQSKRIGVERTLKLAKDLGEHGEFYYMWNCDTRGRYYPLAQYLHPQAPEYGKALLQFKEGVRITTDEELEWLCIHGANVAGKDKLPMKERVEWVYKHSEEIIKSAKDPLGFLWWTEQDKPFLLLAFCFEWERFCREGFNSFVSYLPCYADGTANGIQHLSAMVRDVRGGRAVNLCKSDKPNDIYGDVAEVVVEKLKVLSESEDPAVSVLALEWLRFGINRKMTKRAVMILPYAGTMQGARKYILESYEEGIAAGKNPLKDVGDTFAVCNFITKVIWDSIQEVVVSSKAVMSFIKSIAKLYTKQGKAFSWVSPTGLHVCPQYFAQSSKRIETLINGSIGSYTIHEDNEKKIDAVSIIRAASPNFIHSLDAAAMTLTVNACKAEGINSFAFIHDAYATHSANMPKMCRILRESFADMYTKHDVLEELRQNAMKDLGLSEDKVPSAPPKGSLDVSEVSQAKYFFS
jgi:DNA-directed RNA polymerase, mitochondrial